MGFLFSRSFFKGPFLCYARPDLWMEQRPFTTVMGQAPPLELPPMGTFGGFRLPLW